MRPSELALAITARADLAAGSARARRQRLGVSQSAVARTLGVSHQSVSGWESGRRSPTDEHALAYWRLLARLGKKA